MTFRGLDLIKFPKRHLRKPGSRERAKEEGGKRYFRKRRGTILQKKIPYQKSKFLLRRVYGRGVHPGKAPDRLRGDNLPGTSLLHYKVSRISGQEKPRHSKFWLGGKTEYEKGNPLVSFRATQIKRDAKILAG